MKTKIYSLIFSWFGGTIKARLNSYIVGLVLMGLSQLAKLSPDLVHICNPDKIAAFILAVVLIELNSITNKTHNEILEGLNNTLKDDTISIPVEKAEKVKS